MKITALITEIDAAIAALQACLGAFPALDAAIAERIESLRQARAALEQIADPD